MGIIPKAWNKDSNFKVKFSLVFGVAREAQNKGGI